MKRLPVSLTAPLLGLAYLTPSFAQDAIQEVVVTAERREQNVQDVPISVSAFSSQSLEELGFTKPADLAGGVPGLIANGSVGDSNPIFTIRGIGLNDTFSNNNPTASVYLDEVLIPFNPMLALQLYDLQRVEVLKGPQGTLYGRNTTGGAINLITAKPSSTPDGYVRASYGRFNRGEVEGAFGGPLSDTLSARVSMNGVHQSDGWQHNAFTGEEIGNTNTLSTRGQLQWKPDDATTALLRFDYAQDHSDNQLREHVGSYTAPFGFTPCAGTLAGYRDEGNCVDFLGYSDPTPDRRTVEDSSLYGHRRDSQLYSGGLTLSHAYEPFTITSVTGYSKFKRELGDDSDGAPLIELDSLFTDDIKAFTQEVRLASPAESAIRWVGGLYYSDDTIDGDILQALDQHIFTTRVDTNWTQDTESYSAFGQVEWPLAEKLRLTTGLRYTNEEKKFRYDSIDLNPFGTSAGLPTPVAGIHNKISKDNVSGKLGLDYHLADNAMVYASASRGFKSGGFKAAIAFNPNELDAFDPETLDAYEVGFKSTLAGGKLRLNGAVYYYDWKDFQAFVTENRSGINVVVLSNAGDAHVKGAEAEIRWLAAPGLDLSLGANWMNTEIVRYNGAIGTPDNTGNELANSPKFSGAATARYEFPMGASGLSAYVLGATRYQGSRYFTVANNPQASQAGYGLLDARAGLMGADDKWELALYGKNLTDKLYISQAYDNYPGIFPSQNFLGDPRTYGLSIEYRYK